MSNTKSASHSHPSSSSPWALITGASSGIGAATAQLLSNAGYNTVLLGRRADKLEQVAKSLNRGEHVQAVVDLTKPEQIAKFLESKAAILKNVSVLINNAGLAKGVEKVQDSKVSDWDSMLDTNVRALLHITRGMLPHMQLHDAPHIVNLGSVAGRWVYPGGAVYCATKFAVRAFTEGLRQDLMGTKMRVTNIEPGMVNTEFSLQRLGDQANADAVYAGMTPLSAHDIAETIAWVLARPTHVNIQELVIYPTDQPHVGMVNRK